MRTTSRSAPRSAELKSAWRIIGLKLVLSTAVLLPGRGALSADPPPTEREVVVDNYHGTGIEDLYRWLEGSAGLPEGASDSDKKAVDDRVSKWTDAQNAYTRSVLDKLPGRDRLTKRVSELMNIESIGAPASAGRNYFNTIRGVGQNQPVLYVREGLEGTPRALLDPNALDSKGLISLDFWVPSQDGTLLAFGLSKAGDEIPSLYVMDVATGRWHAEEIPNDAGGVTWLPDNSGFFYQNRRERENAYSAQIKFHALGTHHRQDPILFEQYSETWGPYAGVSRDGRWLIFGYWQSTKSNDLWVVDADHFRRTGQQLKKDIAIGKDGTFGGNINGDILYMQTTWNAPNGAVYMVDLNQPEEKNWKLIIPERKDMTLNGVSLARGYLVANYGYKATTRLEKFDLHGTSLGEIKLPGIGTAGVVTNDDRTEAFLTYTSFNEPPSIYRFDLADPSHAMTLWARPEIPVDPSIVQVDQVTYTSKDGTPVTMFIVHKKGLKLDGNNPTLLYGYGGFDISMTPSFSRTLFPFFEEGGVYAVANLRGGGEYGASWHEAGMLDRKQNVFDDCIAAAEWLIANKYTNKEKLAVAGGSNGGLLTGAMITQRPDLFKAVICDVPLLDMLRYQNFLMARYWVPEYGTSEKPEEFEFLRKYSPYQQVKSDVTYPAILLTAGENDARVHPLHARKMAAALQNIPTADANSRPTLLWVDRQAGHGAGKPLSAQIQEIVDERIFIMWQLGMLEK